MVSAQTPILLPIKFHERNPMNATTLTTYMRRAGFRSRRELAAMTGIPPSTLDDIFRHPQTVRGYLLKEIASACGMTAEEVGAWVMGKEVKK